ncbi:hypothetical protein AXE73_01530 [Gardnerella vaginalis]|uniref:Uncharacterized protein n=1 Tax=Gardnerella vaginalis TaxID=2702 RepID=A0A3E1IWL6_GARVA|nr:hypothetical protein AXE73_01530 [Gardnerella vaginalis]
MQTHYTNTQNRSAFVPNFSILSLAQVSCAHVFATRKVHWALRLSGSALRIAFSRYALSEKAGRRANALHQSEKASRRARGL